jgi:DNA-binding response OmpR family regulator
MKVLIIEDDKALNLEFKAQLEGFNIKTSIANNGVEAYKILYKTQKRYQFDYIVVDLGLPDENGVEIIKFIKSKFTSKIIIYTRKNYEDYKDKCEYDYFMLKKKQSVKDVIDLILQ